jgi:hypothetical protein
MKFIITENQYDRLLLEQKVYTDKKEYEKAIKIYNDVVLMVDTIRTHFDLCEKFFNNGKGNIEKLDELFDEIDNLFGFFNKKYKGKFANLMEKMGVPLDGYKTYEVIYQYCVHKQSDKILSKRKEIIKGQSIIKREGRPTPSYYLNCPSGYYYRSDDPLFLSGTPKKPIYKNPEPKPNIITPPKKEKPPIINNVSTGSTPSVSTETPTKKIEPIKTDFSATFGQDGKQETRYFKTFDEWKKFFDSVNGKFGYMRANYNQSKTEASVLLKGTPEDWGL